MKLRPLLDKVVLKRVEAVEEEKIFGEKDMSMRNSITYFCLGVCIVVLFPASS